MNFSPCSDAPRLRRTRRHGQTKNTEEFVTARKTQGIWRIGWSFMAGVMGAWLISAPGSFASFAGIVGGAAAGSVWPGTSQPSQQMQQVPPLQPPSQRMPSQQMQQVPPLQPLAHCTT
jgi:hypothetical protein